MPQFLTGVAVTVVFIAVGIWLCNGMPNPLTEVDLSTVYKKW